MKLKIIETKKDLFSADFVIMENERQQGELHFVGRLGSMEGEWNGAFLNSTISLNVCRRISVPAERTFRPYKVHLNNCESGYVYQTVCKQSLFKKYDLEQLLLNCETYNLYPIGFGKDGSKNPIYCGEQQIALVEKDCVVYDDLHVFCIAAIDEQSARIAVLFCCYMFTNACYNPGVKITTSVEKNISTTTNKLLLEKYNPKFKENIID